MLKKQKKVFWPTLVLIVLALITYVFVSARVGTVASSKVKPESVMAAQLSLPEFKQRIRVWVHGDDVRPKVNHAWPGKALITVENETPSDVSLQVERVLPQRTLPVDTVNLPSGSKRLQHEVLLVPGEYVFYDASRPNIRRPTVFVDPDGQKIKICDNEGRCEEISDADANKYTFNKGYAKANGFSVKGNNILDAEGNKVGSWVRTSFDDLNETANALIFGDRTSPGLSQMAGPMEKVILGVAAINLAPAVVIVGSPTLAGGGITTLGLSGEAATGGELASLSLSQLNTLIRGTQQQLLRQLFGRGVQGAQEALAAGRLPAGLTREALLVYAEIARRYVEQGSDATGVQALRLEIIKQALEKLK